MLVKVGKRERVCCLEKSDIDLLKDLIELSKNEDNTRIFEVFEDLRVLDLLYVILVNGDDSLAIHIQESPESSLIEELAKDDKHLVWKKFSEFLYHLSRTDKEYPSCYLEFLNRFVVIDETTSYLKVRGRVSIYNEYPVDKLNPINGYIKSGGI